jgi:cytochrome c oxidase subunit 2
MRFHLSLAAAVVIPAAVSFGAARLHADAERVISVTAKRYDFEPASITLKRGEPVVLELRSADRAHSFKLPSLGIRADILPDDVARIRLVPDRAGTFAFACDTFCGSGHEEMDGQIVVID